MAAAAATGPGPPPSGDIDMGVDDWDDATTEAVRCVPPLSAQRH